MQTLQKYDIVFYDINDNPLDHQIESYNPETGEYIAWIKIPTLSPTEDTYIKMLYGNDEITTGMKK